MNELKIEWVERERLCNPERLGDPLHFTAQALQDLDKIPVVRLAEVDALIGEAVWAMEIADNYYFKGRKVADFLASPLVAEWRKRQKEGPR